MSSPVKDPAAAADSVPAPDAGTNAGWGNKKDAALASSWIENEGRCATLAGLALQLSLDRTQAARLLRVVAARGESGGSKRYRATWCEAEATRTAPADDDDRGTEEVVPCTVFRMVSNVHDGGLLERVPAELAAAAAPRTLCALGLESSESPEAAHERDAAQRRDALQRDPRSLLALPSGGSGPRPPPLIVPSAQMKALWQQSLQQATAAAEASAVDGAGAGGTDPAAGAGPPPSKAVRTKTTAASFFGGGAGAAAAKKMAGGGRSKDSSAAVGRSKSEDEKENKESRARAAAAAGKKPAKVVPPPAAAGSAPAASAKVGNADDFVGDMDTDSDDDEEEEQLDGDDAVMTDAVSSDDEKAEHPPPESRARKRAPPASRGRPRVAQPRGGGSGDEGEDDDHPAGAPASEAPGGAMDAFAAASRPKPGAAARMRKRVVQRTFQDEHGYLQTELQEVWEEVPVAASPPKKASSAPAPARPAAAAASNKSGAGKSSGKAGLKQGSLKGFFTKK